MNIVCVYSVESAVSEERPFYGWYKIPYGISYIATLLKQAGHNVKMEVFTSLSNIKKRVNLIVKEYEPDVFCLTAVSTQFPVAVKIAEEIKRVNPSIFVIVGGVHASLNPEEVIGVPAIDAICIGEGEKAVVELISQLEEKGYASGINNIWIKNGEKVEKNPQDPFIQELDSLPIIDREMWTPWIAKRNPWHTDPDFMHSILIGRGCPYKCTYCSNHALSAISEGKYVRFRSVGNVINEIRYIIDRFPSVRQIFFEAETLSLDLKYIYELCSALEELNLHLKQPLSFGANFAINSNIVGNLKLFEHLKKAGFKFLNVGFESGTEKLRKEILHRPAYSNNDIIELCKLAKQYLIRINMYLLVGIPGESRDDFQKTLQCVKECDVNNIFLSILYPYPGTELYKIAKNMGVLKESNKNPANYFHKEGKERIKSYLNLDNFSGFQIKFAQVTAFYKIYRKRWPVFKILLFTLIFNVSEKNGTRLLKFFKLFNKSSVEKYMLQYPF